MMTPRIQAALRFSLLPFALVAFAQCGQGERNATPANAAVQNPANAPQAATAPAPVILGERIHALISGSMEGRLEPCGCASGQLGGLPRRMTYIQEVHGADLLLEGGDLVGGASALDQEKAFTAIDVLFGMQTRYDALGIGKADLALPTETWGQYLEAYAAPVVASDLEPLASQLKPKPFVEKDVRGTKVRIISLTMELPDALRKAEPPQLRLLSPEDGYRRGLEGAPDATLRVLMIHADPDAVRKLVPTLSPVAPLSPTPSPPVSRTSTASSATSTSAPSSRTPWPPACATETLCRRTGAALERRTAPCAAW